MAVVRGWSWRRLRRSPGPAVVAESSLAVSPMFPCPPSCSGELFARSGWRRRGRTPARNRTAWQRNFFRVFGGDRRRRLWGINRCRNLERIRNKSAEFLWTRNLNKNVYAQISWRLRTRRRGVPRVREKKKKKRKKEKEVRAGCCWAGRRLILAAQGVALRARACAAGRLGRNSPVGPKLFFNYFFRI
jgi:hypothetical protein